MLIPVSHIQEYRCLNKVWKSLEDGLMQAVAPKLKQSLWEVGKESFKIGIETISDLIIGDSLKIFLQRRE